MTAEQERPCRHCNGADPFCSVCEGVGSLPNLPYEPVQKVHELPSAEQERDAVVRCLRREALKRYARGRASKTQIDEVLSNLEGKTLANAADAIEAGEHVKETSE